MKKKMKKYYTKQSQSFEKNIEFLLNLQHIMSENIQGLFLVNVWLHSLSNVTPLVPDFLFFKYMTLMCIVQSLYEQDVKMFKFDVFSQ